MSDTKSKFVVIRLPIPVEYVKAIEECIAWSAQQGYCFAGKAAGQLTSLTNREMFESQPYYNAFEWRSK